MLFYHIVNRGNGRLEVFHKDKDYEELLNNKQEKISSVEKAMEGRMETDKRLKSEIENLKMRVINEE